MMGGLMDIFKQRRFWAALIPAAVMVSGAFGVPLTEDILNSTADQVVAGVSAVLSLWSLFAPKPA